MNLTNYNEHEKRKYKIKLNDRYNKKGKRKVKIGIDAFIVTAFFFINTNIKPSIHSPAHFSSFTAL